MNELIRKATLRLLQMHYESGVGHIGGNLSCLALLMTLHHRILKGEDHFILSKGHAAGALYTTLWSRGLLTDEDLQQFHKENTRLAGHPPVDGIPGISFATGSLGHGLGLAAGLALAKRLKGEPGRVFCLTSDGEWNEGSTWEALTFIAHQKLDALTILIDLNGLQGFGTTVEVADLGPIADKLRTFCVDVQEIDGHDPEAIERALVARAARPAAIVARTTKGHGVSFMEHKMEWHYLPLTQLQYEQAIDELSRPISQQPHPERVGS
ncbi:MAG TPA: 1-deoxy-D-xylulose-5-phosphate synthase N-terminal domain-containing protein [Polyangiaceae bacterium]|nr:1-deoxy-D-xylulose-5-phosphate synthase N-terminal domain-containing protein [Polyangiaceae bacterium]